MKFKLVFKVPFPSVFLPHPWVCDFLPCQQITFAPLGIMICAMAKGWYCKMLSLIKLYFFGGDQYIYVHTCEPITKFKTSSISIILRSFLIIFSSLPPAIQPLLPTCRQPLTCSAVKFRLELNLVSLGRVFAEKKMPRTFLWLIDSVPVLSFSAKRKSSYFLKSPLTRWRL